MPVIRFKCDAVADTVGWTKNAKKEWEERKLKSVTLLPVNAGGDEDHANFSLWPAMPSGRLELGSLPPAAAAIFVEGREYELDVRPVEPDR